MKKSILFVAALVLFLSHVDTMAQTFPPLDRFVRGDDGVLDVTIIASSRQVGIGGFAIDSNVYTACYTSHVVDERCPAGSSTNAYGGPLLKVEPGDRLKITLINRMPEYEGMDDRSMGMMTNLHTHGMLVRARGLAWEDTLPEDLTKGMPYEPGSIGDFIFIGAQREGSTPMLGHAAHPINGRTSLRFDIEVPAEHPKGIYWFHPHPHGWSKIQVSGGMAGMISVGEPDYLCMKLDENDPSKCASDGAAVDDENITIREILLKDSQLADLDADAMTGSMFFDQTPDYCGEQTATGNSQGFCVGVVRDGEGDVEMDADGNTKVDPSRRWVYSLNGVALPEWQVDSKSSEPQDGFRNTEIWRIQNASANITYNLCLSADGFPITHDAPATVDDEGEPGEGCAASLPFQVLSLDGVAFGSVMGQGSAMVRTDALQRRAVLMPGSRIEIAVTFRDAQLCNDPEQSGVLNDADCPTVDISGESQTVALENLYYPTGGDGWPAATLGKVTFMGEGASVEAIATNDLQSVAGSLLESARGEPAAGQFHTNGFSNGFCRSHGARRLSKDEKRRIYFGIIEDEGSERFLLGHSVIKADGTETNEWGEPYNQIVLRPFDAFTPQADLCILAGGEETWQLVNISHEVHNFHIHQGKFSVACDEQKSGNCLPRMHAPIGTDRVNLSNAVIYTEQTPTPGSAVHDTIIVPRGAKPEDVESPATEQHHCASEAIEGDSAGSFIRRAEGFSQQRPVYVYSRENGHCLAPEAGNEKQDAGWIEVRIPFDQPWSKGKYMFHCHILEHEDLGMMASVRVLSPEQLSALNGTTMHR